MFFKKHNLNYMLNTKKIYFTFVKIILDTNALLMPFQFKINIDAELKRLFGSVEILVPDCVIKELHGINIKEEIRKSALMLSKKYKRVESYKEGDEGVLETAINTNSAILTNDIELKKNAIKKGVMVVSMRGKNHLYICGRGKEEW